MQGYCLLGTISSSESKYITLYKSHRQELNDSSAKAYAKGQELRLRAKKTQSTKYINKFRYDEPGSCFIEAFCTF